jgi:hypothetical protein
VAVKKTAESFVRQKIRSPYGCENRSKPAVLSLLEISPLSRFCSYYGDRSEVSEAALEEKDSWRRGGTPRAPVRSLSSVCPSFPRLRPRAIGWTSEELRPWRLARRCQSGSCPSPRRRVLLRVPDSSGQRPVGGIGLLGGGGGQEELDGGGCQGGALPDVARAMRGWRRNEMGLLAAAALLIRVY